MVDKPITRTGGRHVSYAVSNLRRRDRLRMTLATGCSCILHSPTISSSLKSHSELHTCDSMRIPYVGIHLGTKYWCRHVWRNWTMVSAQIQNFTLRDALGISSIKSPSCANACEAAATLSNLGMTGILSSFRSLRACSSQEPQTVFGR